MSVHQAVTHEDPRTTDVNRRTVMTETTPPPAPTSNGHAVTDESIERLAAEAEAGYDPARLRPVVGRPAMGSAAARVVPVRLDPELEAALRQRAESEHASTSTVIRQALRAWLTPA